MRLPCSEPLPYYPLINYDRGMSQIEVESDDEFVPRPGGVPQCRLFSMGKQERILCWAHRPSASDLSITCSLGRQVRRPESGGLRGILSNQLGFSLCGAVSILST